MMLAVCARVANESDRQLSTVIFALGLTQVHPNQHTYLSMQVSVHSPILINFDAYKINMIQVLKVHCIAG